MKKSYKSLSFVIAVAAAVCACNRIEEFGTPIKDGVIAVRVNEAHGLATKSADEVTHRTYELGHNLFLEETVTDNIENQFVASAGTKGTIVMTETLPAFWMNGYANNYEDIDPENPEDEPSFDGSNDEYMLGAEAEKGTTWTLKTDYPWLTGINFTFWSYYPQAPATGSFVFGETGDREEMTIKDFVVNSTVTDQEDILIAYNNQTYSSSKTVVDITFHHALAAVRFDISDVSESLTISNISIMNIKGQGSCAVSGESVPTFTWTPGGDNVDFAQDFASSDFEAGDLYDKADGEADERTALQGGTSAEGSKIFFMIPQTLGTGAVIGITLSDNTYLEANLANVTWTAGKMYTYKLSLGGLDVDIADAIENGVKSDVVVTNVGQVQAFVRVAIVANWFDNNGVIVAPWTDDVDKSALGTNWVYNSTDGYYYYTGVVNPGCRTGQTGPDDSTGNHPIFASYTAPATAPVTGAHLVMDLAVQAVPVKIGGTTYTSYSEAWAAAKAAVIPTVNE